MNQLLDLAMALILSPRQALMEITNEEKLKEGFFIWIFVVLLMSLSLFQQGPGLVMQFLLMILFMGAALLVHSVVIDYISGFWGGMGTARGITAGFMAASLPLTPYILIVIFFIALMALGVAAAVEGIANMQDMQSLESMITQM